MGKWYRRSEDILLFLALTVSAFLMVNISIFVNRILEENHFTRPYNYSISLSTTIMGSFQQKDREEKIRELIYALKEISIGNVSMEIPMYLNERIEQAGVQILLRANEEVSVLEREKPYSSAEQGVFIGESILPNTFFFKNERFINLSGMQLPVAGILQNHYAGRIDETILLQWDLLSEEQQNNVISQMISSPMIHLQSQGKLDSVYAFIMEKLNRLGVEGVIIKNQNGALEDQWYRMYNTIFQGVAMMFCFVTCVAASSFWLSVQFRDIAIRRAFGYSWAQMLLFLWKGILKIEWVSFVLSFLVELLFHIAIGEGFPGLDWIFVFFVVLILQNMLIACGIANFILKTKRKATVIFLREE